MTEISRLLTRRGVRSVRINYEDDNPIGLSFTIPTPGGPRDFRLPANIDAIQHLLERDQEAGKLTARQATRDRAFPVAWRIIKDWLEAQLTLIDVEMVTMTEVMLPYLLDDHGVTLYELVANRHFLLGPGDREGQR